MNTVRSTFFQTIKRKELLLILILIIAGISLLGWLTGKMGLASFSLIYKPISPILAVTFIALCISFLISIIFEKSRLTKSLLTFLVIIITLFYCLIFLGYFFNFTQDIENIFIKNPERFGNVLTGRISPISSLLFVLICISLLSVRQNSSGTIKYIGSSFTLLGCLVSSVLLIGYLYKAPLLYGGRVIPVSLPTAICFLLFSILLLQEFELRFWTYNLIKDNKITRQLLKSFLPIIVFIVILQGYLITNFSFLFINPTLSIALILLIIVTLTILILFRVSAIIGNQLLRAEEALRESEKQLFQLNADKDLFISILGHDLKSPFSVLLGYSELLFEDIHKLEIPEIENQLNHINKAAQNTYNLLEDILMWARTQQGKIPFKPQNIFFADICKNIIEILTPTANAKNITLNYSTADGITVFADIDMLKTILRNLISNAIKFTNSGGVIKINAKENSGNVTISVSDNGIGIRPDYLTKLFDIAQVRTTTGTAEEKGTGLGLLLCKEFVEKHKGRIWIESEYGKGSIFSFTIPYNAESKVINVVRDPEELFQIRNLKILIADDNEILSKVLTAMVKRYSKEILYAETGAEAVAVYQNNPDIDLILMDFYMPNMNGYEATKLIRLINKEVIIFIQTALTNSDEIKESTGAEVNDYFDKPYNKTLFNQLIKKHFNKKNKRTDII